MIKRHIGWLIAFIIGTFQTASAENLVILHTNDTHSQIEPTEKNLGGIQRRKVLIDSVRNVHQNVMLVDAGDMVQGTLYFTLFGGEVESKLMNYLGYDVQILGNHEFDNGVEELAKIFGSLKAERLSTNYDFTDTPLAPLFKPFIIKEVGGRRIGFIAINLNPKGMIADKKSQGVIYLDGIKAANATAWHLRHNEKVDMVVALSHIGYAGRNGINDITLAKNSEDIDIIIGGHSHTTIDPKQYESPAWLIDNAVGRPVLVAQSGRGGLNVGEIVIDLDSLTPSYGLLPVDSRYDKNLDPGVDAILAPYRKEVDDFRNYKLASTKTGMYRSDWGLVNWMADFVLNRGREIMGKNKKVDMAIVNRGGVRSDIQPGNITKGTIMQIFPFDNRTVIIEIKGSDLLDALNVMAARDGDGVSGNVNAPYDPSTGKCVTVAIDGVEIDPEKLYTVATIDYLATGGDYMEPLTKGTIIAESPGILYEDIIESLSKKHQQLKADKTLRMYPVN